MSVELIVLSERRLASMSDWQQAIDSDGFRVALATDVSIDELSGFLPVRLNDAKTGFECDYCDVNDVVAQYPNVNFRRHWPFGLVFRWNGDFDECLAAHISAAAYAKAAGGIVFDPQDSLLMSPQETLAQVTKIQHDSKMLRALARIAAERVGRGS